MARPISYLTLVDIALLRFSVSLLHVITTNNILRRLIHVEVRFASCLLMALADLIVLDKAETAVLLRTSINFAALDAALGLVLIVTFKKVSKTIRRRNI